MEPSSKVSPSIKTSWHKTSALNRKLIFKAEKEKVVLLVFFSTPLRTKTKKKKDKNKDNDKCGALSYVNVFIGYELFTVWLEIHLK